MNNPDSAIVYFVDYNKPQNPGPLPQLDGCVFWYESNAKKFAAKYPNATITPKRLVEVGLGVSDFEEEIEAGE